MTHASSSFDPGRLRAIAAQAQLWLLEMLAWLADLFGNGRIGRAVRAGVLCDLHHLRRGVASVLVLLALRALPAPPPGPRRVCRPPNAPRGWTRSRKDLNFRGALRLVRTGRGVRGRIASLAAVLDDLDAWTARMVARLGRQVFVAAYVLTCAPVEAVVAQARVATAFADSS